MQDKCGGGGGDRQGHARGHSPKGGPARSLHLHLGKNTVEILSLKVDLVILIHQDDE